MRAWRTLLFGSAPYHLALSWPSRGDIALRLAWRWPGDKARGAALLAGGALAWDGAADEATRAWLHGFAWLADLAALQSPAAAAFAQDAAAAWERRFGVYDEFAWAPDLIGDRLFHWLAHLDLVAPAPGNAGLLRSFRRQVRHLARVAEQGGVGLARLHAMRGLVAASAALGGRRRIARAQAALAREIERQFFADGGHRARSPDAQLAALILLIDARTALVAAAAPVSDALQGAIERAALMLRFFRHGDGGFALFNGADEGDRAAIDRVLARAEMKGQTPLTAPDSGWERLQAGNSVVLFDCGAPPASPFDRAAHAGTLSFEISHGARRIVVNCGAHGPGDWRAALSATAAHSTLVVADTNSATFGPDGGLAERPGAVTHQRVERAGDLWTAATHDGYQAKFGLSHGRQLFLAADGDDLRGEDALTGAAGRGFIIRFHLHPAVEAALQPDANAVLLQLPGGERWRLRAEGAVLSLGESIYAGAGQPEKTQQVVLDGHVGSSGSRVRWAIRRERDGA